MSPPTFLKVEVFFRCTRETRVFVVAAMSRTRVTVSCRQCSWLREREAGDKFLFPRAALHEAFFPFFPPSTMSPCPGRTTPKYPMLQVDHNVLIRCNERKSLSQTEAEMGKEIEDGDERSSAKITIRPRVKKKKKERQKQFVKDMQYREQSMVVIRVSRTL